MKRGAALLLLELVIMLLVFSLAAALCVQAFVWADSRSRQSAQEDMALLQAQNAAEVLKHCGGDFSEAANLHGGQGEEDWRIFFDENWNMTPNSGAFTLQAVAVSPEMAGLGRAELTVTDQTGKVLAKLPACWQEVMPE